MGRHTSMIPMNGEIFKNIVQAKQPLSSLEKCLDVSKQAINAWISGNKIPPSKLSTLVRELKLTSNEIIQITQQKRERPSIVFKSTRNVELPDEIKDKVILIAEDYFRLDVLIPSDKKFFSEQVKMSSPKEMAEYIATKLELRRGDLNIKQVVNALKRFSVSVLFYNFDNDKINAVCVKKDNSRVIFINTHERVEDVCWRIFHEVCHIVCGHTTHSKEDEQFCNSVATEIVTPIGYFEHYKEFFKENFYGEFNTNQILIVEELTRRLGAGFIGVVLRTKEAGLMSGKVFKGFMAYWNSKRKNDCLRVENIFNPHGEENLVSHWEEILSDPDKDSYLHFQVLVLKALVQEKISYEKASDVMGYLDIKSTQELAEIWQRKLKI